MTEEPEDRPHLIRQRDVPAWLAGSACQEVTYHRTSRSAADSIVREGVRIHRSYVAAYGQGFYTATDPDAFYGDVLVRVAISMRNPLQGSVDELEEVIDRMTRQVRPLDPRLTPEAAALIRRRLVALGYDGIVVGDGGGDGIDYFIAILDETVRVVVD